MDNQVLDATGNSFHVADTTSINSQQHEDHGNNCCDGSEQESSLSSSMKQKMMDIFHVSKLGLLIPVQDLVEKNGIGILNEFDKDGHTPVHWAALGGHTHVIRYFAQVKAPLDTIAQNILGAQPIHWACVNGHISIADILIQAGISIDSVDNKGCTPLIIAAQYGRTMLAGFLMGKGARLQITDKEGDNALHWAAFKGHCELTRLLIYSGFNPRQKDNFGQCPLHLAALSGDLLTCKLLCEQDGADVDLEDHNGNTPSKLAKGRKYKDLISYFEGLKSRNLKCLPSFDLKSLIFGPPGMNKGAFMFMIFLTCFYGYPCYILKVLPLTIEFQITHLLFFVNTVVMWYSLVKAHNADPGFLPKNADEYDQALKQVAYFYEWKRGQNPLSRLCHTCRLVRPLRAKHCRVTNRCVKHFDHYCPYIYNVVGYRNRHFFLVFLYGMTFTLLTGDFFVWYINKYIHRDVLLIIGGVIMGMFTLVAAGLAVFTTYQALTNITTNERLNYKRYDYLNDANNQFCNPYDKGWNTNLKEFFHLKEPLTLTAAQLDDNLQSVEVI